MTRSQELFELLARRARARQAEKASSSQPVAEAPEPKSKQSPARQSRPPEAAEERQPVEVEAPARIAAADAIVLSRRGAVLLGVLTALLVAVAFLAGERVGRTGGLVAAPISALAPGSMAPVDDAEPAAAEVERAPKSPAPGEKTYGIRVVTYEFSQANAQRANEVKEYLKSQGFRDVDAVFNKSRTEVRIYAGRYSSDTDPALKSMLEKTKSLSGDGKGKKESKPFSSAYIMARGD